jgi:hypothetical protein
MTKENAISSLNKDFESIKKKLMRMARILASS